MALPAGGRRYGTMFSAGDIGSVQGRGMIFNPARENNGRRPETVTRRPDRVLLWSVNPDLIEPTWLPGVDPEAEDRVDFDWLATTKHRAEFPAGQRGDDFRSEFGVAGFEHLRIAH